MSFRRPGYDSLDLSGGSVLKNIVIVRFSASRSRLRLIDAVLESVLRDCHSAATTERRNPRLRIYLEEYVHRSVNFD
jgi:hypothetical protein